ncbi:MAG: hypothetical protein LBU09_01335 [Endomicrobium sp.]|jgi:peptidoglycan hydrolase CwlO-like protein|nr:hypothetical protein [Endomicrobium sp.]
MNEIKNASLCLVVVYLFGALTGAVSYRLLFEAKHADGQYRTVVDEANAKYRELESRNAELEAELERISAAIDDRTANMERTIGTIADDNSDALDAVERLREIQKQIQSRVLNSGSDSGGTDSGDDNII